MDFAIIFKKNSYSSLEEFAMDIYKYPNEAFAVIKSQKFLKILYNLNQKMYNRVVELLNQPFQVDALLFKIQYVLNPLMGIRYHGYKFDNFSGLGKQIVLFGPKTDIYLKDFLKYQLLSYYMEVTKYDIKEPVIYQKVKELEEEFKENEDIAYFKLGFILEGSNTIYYREKKFTDIKEFLINAMKPVNITDFAARYVKSQYMYAWLEILGMKEKVILFENLVSSVEQKEKENDHLRKV